MAKNKVGKIQASHVEVGDKTYNLYAPQQIAHIHTPPQFVEALRGVQGEIAALRLQGGLGKGEQDRLEAAEKHVKQAAAEAQKPQPEAGKITKRLKSAQETMDQIKGSVQSAVGLGATLAGLIQIIMKLWGE
ncbi:MAG: hypothetical protein L0Z70_11100 [Chloroflexi bacterium]|nr:hypothetical protein [Chloroflexota bacterium]